MEIKSVKHQMIHISLGSKSYKYFNLQLSTGALERASNKRLLNCV